MEFIYKSAYHFSMVTWNVEFQYRGHVSSSAKPAKLFGNLSKNMDLPEANGRQIEMV